MSKGLAPVIGVLLIVVGISGMVVVGAVQPSVQDIGCAGGACARGEAGSTSSSGVDAMFIEQMIPHHDDAIAMSDIALTRAEHPELLALARQIKETQSAENTRMRTWYREWFDSEVPVGSAGMFGGGMMGGGMMGSTMTPAELSEADPFDKAFIEQMIPHHEMGIMMARMAGNTATTAEIRGLTASIIESQSREIEQMREWYREWYSTTPGR